MADLEEPCPLYGIEEKMRLKCDGAFFFGSRKCGGAMSSRFGSFLCIYSDRSISMEPLYMTKEDGLSTF